MEGGNNSFNFVKENLVMRELQDKMTILFFVS